MVNIICTHCFANSLPNANFCSTCGVGLKKQCIECHVIYDLASNFCVQCGYLLMRIASANTTRDSINRETKVSQTKQNDLKETIKAESEEHFNYSIPSVNQLTRKDHQHQSNKQNQIFTKVNEIEKEAESLVVENETRENNEKAVKASTVIVTEGKQLPEEAIYYPNMKIEKRLSDESVEIIEISDDDDDDDANNKSTALFDQPLTVEGIRQRKSTQRFQLVQPEAPKVEILKGSGVRLGDIARIENNINKYNVKDLKKLYKICFSQVGRKKEMKKDLKQFNGFNFNRHSSEYEQKKNKLLNLKLMELILLCDLLDLKKFDTKIALVLRILQFLLKPVDSGRIVPNSISTSSSRKE